MFVFIMIPDCQEDTGSLSHIMPNNKNMESPCLTDGVRENACFWQATCEGE